MPVKVENDDLEGHPPGENEEVKSDDQSETVCEFVIYHLLL